MRGPPSTNSLSCSVVFWRAALETGEAARSAHRRRAAFPAITFHRPEWSELEAASRRNLVVTAGGERRRAAPTGRHRQNRRCATLFSRPLHLLCLLLLLLLPLTRAAQACDTRRARVGSQYGYSKVTLVKRARVEEHRALPVVQSIEFQRVWTRGGSSAREAVFFSAAAAAGRRRRVGGDGSTHTHTQTHI